MKRNQSTALVRLVSSSLRLSLALGVVGVFASVSSAVGVSRDTYYVNDHLATTMATADASGEIAQIEADAFGTQTGPVAKDTRFTGKPYDADMGAYVFPFRNYRSDEARWMSADPSGFPDGVNSQTYSDNPISKCDPWGLFTVYVSGTTTGATSGALSMSILQAPHQVGSEIEAQMAVQWSISGSPSGWIVQHISIQENTSTTYDYYETWQVTNGIVGSDATDLFYITGSGSNGTAVINGSASFYTTSQVGTSSPASWETSSPGTLPAGGLGATTTAPSWYSAGGVTHTLRLTWTE